MPLIHSPSKKALGKNIATEMRANPSPEKRNQNIAIAYSVKRQAMKKKKMAFGGDPLESDDDDSTKSAQMNNPMGTMKNPMGTMGKYADGGEITANDESESGNSIDEAKTKRDMAMSRGHSMMDGDELEATHESMSGNSIDDADDSREMDMTKPKPRFARGGEITANDESMAGNDIDEASDAREMDMLDAKPRRHKDELLARDIGHPDEDSSDDMEMGMLHTENQPDSYSKSGIINYAKGGSVADHIMSKRRMMADGGEVDLQNNSDEQLNDEDQLSFQAPRKKTYYDDSQMSAQPEDSNMKSDPEEMDSHDEHDMIKNIRLKMKKSGMI
jgi:hypothetical protein